MRDKLGKVWDFLKGKKTYVSGIAGLIYGVLENQPEIVLISLGLFGLRHGLVTEIASLMKKK